MKTNIPPFFVGQKVVVKISHEKRHFMQGDKFIVKAIRQRPCCGNWDISIGITTGYQLQMCIKCGEIEGNKDFYAASRFAPIEEQPMPLLTFQKIKEKEKEELLILN